MKRLIFLLKLIFICSYSLTQPGALDLTFNPNDFGTGLGFGANNEVYATAIQTDGKILIGGNFTVYNGVTRNGIARLNTDGTLDTSFDPGTGISGSLGRVHSIAVKSNGSILIGGNFTTYNGVARSRIAQLNPDGTLDTSFDPGTGADNTVSAIVVKSDGRILISGWFNNYNGASRNRIAGLNADGSIDNFFLPGAGAQGGYAVSAIALQGSGPGGKIIIGGWFTTYEGVTKNNIARLNADGSIDNTFNSGTGTNDEIYSLAIQSDGKILVGGYFSSFNGTTRNRIARLNFNGDLDNTFNPGSGTGASSAVYSILPLSNGKIIIAGSFISYGGTAQNSISRLNSNGTLDTGFNSAGGLINSISLQPDGQLIIGGNFTSYAGAGQGRVTRISSNGNLDVTFNPASGGANAMVGTIALQPDHKILLAGDFTIYDGMARRKIARANPDGSIDPSFNAGNGPYSSGNIYAIAVQNDGKILVGGNFTGFQNIFTGVGRIVRLNPDGTLDMTFNVGGIGPTGVTGSSSVGRIIVQQDGKILIGGGFDFYNGTPRTRIARLNTDGSLDTTFDPGADLIPVTLPNSTTVLGADMHLQSDGKIIIFGVFQYSYNGEIKNGIIRINSDGSYDPTFDSGIGIPYVSGNQRIYSVETQVDNKILIGGNFTSYNAITANHLCRLNSDGSFDNTLNTGTGINNGAGALTIVGVQTDGKIIARGAFTSYNGTTINKLARIGTDGTLDLSFDPGTGPSTTALNTAILQPDEKILIGGGFTSYDGIGRSRIARVLRNCVSSSSGTDTHVACGSLTWGDGNTYIANNTQATYTLFDAANNGCDSVITLNLTILPLAENTISETACGSYTWTSGNGETYTSSAIITHTVPNGGTNSCDSIVTLQLTILEPVTYTDVQTACESFTWIDNNTYTESNNTATYIIPGGAANSCDSIITLNLTINQPTTGTDVQTVCESYTWIDGNTYTESNNTATYVLTNSNNCDSIVTLDLTILQPTTATDVHTACGSFTWINGTTYTSSNNTATHTLTGSNTCDSIVTLDLTILPVAGGTDVQVSCDPFTWINGTTYTSNNSTATHTIQGGAANNCDSVVTLNLTVINITTTVTNNGSFLSPNYSAGDLYEWIDCNTEEIVFTGQNFYPEVDGSYKVKITKGDCEETSTCYTVSGLSLEDISKDDFVIYPNPTKGLLHIDGVKVESIRVLSLNGQEILSAFDTNSINVSNLAAGCYFVEVNNTAIKMFSKE